MSENEETDYYLVNSGGQLLVDRGARPLLKQQRDNKSSILLEGLFSNNRVWYSRYWEGPDNEPLGSTVVPDYVRKIGARRYEAPPKKK